MQIKTEKISSSKAVLIFEGRMDVESSPNARQAIIDLGEHGVIAIAVNLSGVEFMDSSGLSALVSGMKALRKKGGNLSICNANAQIRTALRLTMLDRIFPVHDNVEQALLALDETPPAP